jgi:hypothetical protein
MLGMRKCGKNKMFLPHFLYVLWARFILLLLGKLGRISSHLYKDSK